MSRNHVRIHSRHSAVGPAVWVFIAVLSLFLMSLFALAWLFYELAVLAVDLAAHMVQL